MKELEAENATLKRMYAELSLEIVPLKDVFSRKFEGRLRSVRPCVDPCACTATESVLALGCLGVVHTAAGVDGA